MTDVTRKFTTSDWVKKKKGAEWHGRVCGFYSTALTPVGYAVESAYEIGSVQIYPEDALIKWELEDGAGKDGDDRQG